MRQHLLGHYFDDRLLPVNFLKRAQRNVERVVNAHLVMRTDVVEHDDDYTVTAELPGFDKDAITVKYADNWLTIRAHRTATSDTRNDDGRILHHERTTSDLTRQFHLTAVVENQIQAHYDDGLLTVTLPKQAADRASSIEIQ